MNPVRRLASEAGKSPRLFSAWEAAEMMFVTVFPGSLIRRVVCVADRSPCCGPRLLITASVAREYSYFPSPMAVRGHFDCFVASKVFVYICYLPENPFILCVNRR